MFYMAIEHSTEVDFEPMREITVLKWAVLSRLTVITLSILSSTIVPTYDLSFDVRTTETTDSTTTTDSILDSLARWDGVYFVRLAETSLTYEFEQFHAFFPLLPSLMSTTTRALLPNETPLARHHLILSGVLITNVSFVLATLCLYRLTLLLYQRSTTTTATATATATTTAAATTTTAAERKAYTSALLLCFSPASIFFSAVYTESLFLLLTLLFLYCYLRYMIECRTCVESHNERNYTIVWWFGATVFGVLVGFFLSSNSQFVVVTNDSTFFGFFFLTLFFKIFCCCC